MTLKEHSSTKELQKTVSHELFSFIKDTLKQKERVSLILSGGRTPLGIFEDLKQNDLKKIPWDKLHVYWLDERYVPHSNPESNFGNAHKALFHLTKNCHIYPIDTSLSTEEACRSYEKILEDSPDFPHFDYALLGVGPDGHIASLFKKEDNQKEKSVVATKSPDGLERISMTTKIINSVRKKVLIGTGHQKKEIIMNYLEGKNKELPISLMTKENLVVHLSEAQPQQVSPRDTTIGHIRSISHAYEIQYKSMAKQKDKIKAWKLGGTTKKTRTIFDTDSTYYGPILEEAIFHHKNPIKLPSQIIKPVGELEISFKLSSQIKNLSLEKTKGDKALQFIQSIFASVELPWSSYPLPEAGLKVLIADWCASGALVLGCEIPWQNDLRKNFAARVSMTSGEKILTEGSLKNILEDPLEAFRSFLKLAIVHNLPLKPGQIIASGGASNCVPLPLNKKISVHFENLDDFDFTLAN